MIRGWWFGLLAASMLGMLAGCPQSPRRAASLQEAPQQLGFSEYVSISLIENWWQQIGGPAGVRSAWLSPDQNSLLLELRQPASLQLAADAAPEEATAVLIERNPVLKLTALQLEGRLLHADLTARQLRLELTDEIGSTLWLERELDGSNAVFVTPAAADPEAPALAADDSAGGSWVYYPPEGSSSGSGREAAEAHGAVLRFHQPNAEPIGYGLGKLVCTQLAGQHAKQRAALVCPGAGVLLLDYRVAEDPQLSWLLRDSGETGLFLQPAAEALLCLRPEGIMLISLDQLVELAGRLLAGNQLSAALTRRLKPAVEAIGWDWGSVQINPLTTGSGRLSLFDTADMESTTAELDWDISAGRAARLLITRDPREVDTALRSAEPAARDKALASLLELLGWPGASSLDSPPAQTGDSADAASETVLHWQLGQAGSAGSLHLWLTPDVALWDLQASAEQI